MFQKIFLSIVLFCAASVVMFFLLIKVIDFNEYKPKIQKAIKENTGYEIVIKGDITLSLSPVGVRIFEIDVKNPYDTAGRSFATLGSLDVAVELAPLFNKEMKVKHVTFDKLDIMIEKNKSGQYNYELPPSKPVVEKKVKTKMAAPSEDEEPFPLVNIKKVRFSDASVAYLDLATQLNAAVKKINLSIYDMSFDVSRHNKLQGLFLRGDAHIETMQYDSLKVSSLSTNIEMKDAVVSMDNLIYTLFDSSIQGSGKLDLSAKTPKIVLKHKMSDMRLATLSKALWGKEIFDGSLSGELKLGCSLGGEEMIKSTLGGFVFLEGTKINVKEYDVKKMIASLKDPKNASLTEFFMGNFKGFSGNSLLENIIFKTDIEYSEMQFSDVAFTTPKHRVAIQGGLHLIEEKFLDVKVALVNPKGCATFEQVISGDFKKPIVKIEELLPNAQLPETVPSPNVTKKRYSSELKLDENCTPLYEGLLKHPEMK